MDANFAGTLPLAMLLAFGSAKLVGAGCERLRIPSIAGEILAGVLIGPSVLHWLAPNQLLGYLSDLGVMFLLFRTGLEVKASELLEVGRTAVLVAVLGVLLPLLLGWVLMLLWGASQIESLFVGAALVATSVGITAQTLAAMGRLQTRPARIILAAAIIDDVLGLIVLAVVSSVAKGDLNVVQLGATAALSIGFVVLAAGLGIPAMRRLVPKLGEAEFPAALILLFALSVFAAYAGVAAIIGAFLAGMILAESASPKVHESAAGVNEFLTPFFLVGIGLHLRLDALATPANFMLAGLVTLVAVLSKFYACALGAMRFGWHEAKQVGAGMVPRGEVGMVVAQIGISLGTIAQPIYGVVVVMAILTTLIAPVMLRKTFGD